MTSRFLPRGGALAAAALAVALTAAPAFSQTLVIEDFEAGFAGEFVFAGAEPAVLGLTGATPDGSAQAASFFADADEYGGFTGFGQPVMGGPADISAISDPVVVFDLAATGTFTLELNFQNTGGGGEGEIRNALRFLGADGSFQTYRLPLTSFFETNPASFELDDVFQYVWTILDAAGDGDPATTETGFVVDNLRIESGLSFTTDLVAEDFDDGDFSDTNGFFYFAGGEGIAATATGDTPDGSPAAFAGALDGDEFGGFAGFGATFAAAPIDATQYESLNFLLKTNGPARIELNLQTGAAAGGSEGRESFVVGDTGGEYVPVSIPLEAFIQSSATPPDFSDVFNFVFVFLDLPGDGDAGTLEFEFAVDAIGFGSQAAASVVVADAGPDQTVVAGQTVTLDGSGSTGADTFAWTIDNAVLSGAGTTMPTFCADDPGAYTATLTVVGGGGSDSDDVTVTAISVLDAIDGLVFEVLTAPGPSRGQKRLLITELKKTERAIERGDDPTPFIDTFRTRVQNFETNGVLTPAQADAFLAAIDAIDEGATSPCLTAGIGPATASATAATFGLSAPYPNPSAGRATVAFSVEAETTVRLTVLDALGREVAVLADGPVEAGPHTAELDGAALPAGTYLVRLVTSDGQAATERMTRLR